MPSWSASVIADTVTPILAAFPARLGGEVEVGLDAVGVEIEDFAKSLVPVRTGFLQSTIFHEARGLVLDFGATANYASFVEFGTSRMAARPYIRPALDAHSQRILDAILAGALNALTM